LILATGEPHIGKLAGRSVGQPKPLPLVGGDVEQAPPVRVPEGPRSCSVHGPRPHARDRAAGYHRPWRERRPSIETSMNRPRRPLATEQRGADRIGRGGPRVGHRIADCNGADCGRR
jgi:hypothetical protein